MKTIKDELENLKIEILEDLKYLEGTCSVEDRDIVEEETIGTVIKYLNNSNRVENFKRHPIGDSIFFKIYGVGIEKNINNRVEIYVNFKHNNDEKIEICIY